MRDIGTLNPLPPPNSFARFPQRCPEVASIGLVRRYGEVVVGDLTGG